MQDSGFNRNFEVETTLGNGAGFHRFRSSDLIYWDSQTWRSPGLTRAERSVHAASMHEPDAGRTCKRQSALDVEAG